MGEGHSDVAGLMFAIVGVMDTLLISVAAISGLLLFIVLALDAPFAGDLSVPPDAFRDALEEMRRLR